MQKKQGYHHGDLRRALIQAALQIIEQEGAAALTLRAVARRAGVSHTAPYRHYQDKTEMLAVVAEDGFRALKQKIERAFHREKGDPLKKFRAVGIAYVRFARKNKAHYRVMFGPELTDRSVHAGLEAASDAAFQILIDSIKACQDEGLAIPMPTRDLALFAWSTIHGIIGLFDNKKIALTRGETEVEHILETLGDLIERGISVQPKTMDEMKPQ